MISFQAIPAVDEVNALCLHLSHQLMVVQLYLCGVILSYQGPAGPCALSDTFDLGVLQAGYYI